jgi:hypothetical protein
MFPTVSRLRRFHLVLAAAIAATGLFTAVSVTQAGDGGGILGDDLAELEKTVDSLPAAGERKQTPTPPEKGIPALPPPSQNSAKERAPVGPGVPSNPQGKPADGSGTTTRRPGNPVEPPLPPTTDGGGLVIPPPPGELQPPRIGGGVAKGTLTRQDWELEKEGGAWFRNGLLVFDAPGEGQSPTATLSRNLKGDFDLRIDYVITATDARKASGAAFGIRLDSPATESQLSVDRKIDPDEGDKVIVAKAGDIKPLLTLKPSGLAGAIRVRRRGDRFQVLHGNADGSRWTEMGEVNVHLADEIHLWMVGFTDWAGARVTVHRMDLTRPER